MACRVYLPSGDRVGYDVFGDPHGAPVVLFHGFSDSRLTGRVFDAAARRQNVRLLALDRPGIGCSTGSARSFAAVASWFDATVSALGLDRVPIVAVSGGGPFALAAARFVPERVERAVVVSGLGPPRIGYRGMPPGQRLAVAVARVSPSAAARVLAGVARVARSQPDLFLRVVAAHSSETDATAVRKSASLSTVVEPFVEAYRRGPCGVSAELRLLFRPWDFDPADIRTEVRFEHGVDDVTVPPSVARALASRIPSSSLRLRTGAGHFTIVPRHADEVVAVALGGSVPPAGGERGVMPQ